MKTYKIELTESELHDLYDLLYMESMGDIRLNKLEKGWKSIMNKIEPIVIPELYKKTK